MKLPALTPWKEFLSARGDTIAVVSVPASVVRGVRDREILAVRALQHG
jgi:hypothetical protein